MEIILNETKIRVEPVGQKVQAERVEEEEEGRDKPKKGQWRLGRGTSTALEVVQIKSFFWGGGEHCST